MRGKWIAMVAIAGLAACAETTDDEAGMTADTALVPGQETIEVEQTVPTTDTVVRTTDVDVDVDTIEGEAGDTIR